MDVAIGIINGLGDQVEADGQVDCHHGNPSHDDQHIVHHREDVAAEGIGTTVLGTAVLPSSIVVRSLK